MSPDNPIGLCCSRPQLNAVGGIDERTWPYELVLVLRRLKRTLEPRPKPTTARTLIGRGSRRPNISWPLRRRGV
jgi:hypothetical protein